MDGDAIAAPSGAISANIREAMLKLQADDDDNVSVRDDLDDDLDAYATDGPQTKKAVNFQNTWSKPDAAGLQNSAPIFSVVA